MTCEKPSDSALFQRFPSLENGLIRPWSPVFLSSKAADLIDQTLKLASFRLDFWTTLTTVFWSTSFAEDFGTASRWKTFLYGEVFILGFFFLGRYLFWVFFLFFCFFVFLFLVPWSAGPLIPWCPGHLVPPSSRPLIVWSPVPWSSGPLVLWFPGPISFIYSLCLMFVSLVFLCYFYVAEVFMRFSVLISFIFIRCMFFFVFSFGSVLLVFLFFMYFCFLFRLLSLLFTFLVLF